MTNAEDQTEYFREIGRTIGLSHRQMQERFKAFGEGLAKGILEGAQVPHDDGYLTEVEMDTGDRALQKAKADLTVPTPERNRIFAWLDVEFAQYGQTVDTTNWDYDSWLDLITTYLGNARMHGVDSLEGRQALMKAISTTIDAGEWAIKKYGDPPLPGHPSGEIVT